MNTKFFILINPLQVDNLKRIKNFKIKRAFKLSQMKLKINKIGKTKMKRKKNFIMMLKMLQVLHMNKI